ncbi:hypothetical protein QYE76_027815 [Lolium multiflorum]|uniref:Uncharacterized protein n=1 Tax=Lolium multiflorum TaxID=4521 RepID=A0AAD8VDY5_LOLMU|nr:hypothetical protein QYE76_027815 [Lolium multiflorum]
MGDINNTHGGGGAAAGATFPVAMYVLFLSYLALLLVPCSDLIHVLSFTHLCRSILIPHFSTADCADVDGYHVLSGTRVFINVWAIGRDPDAWQKPEEFAPERFMEGGSAAAVDFRGSNFEFMPFGAGRRMCPGLNFGLIAVEIMLANLVYCHDWALPAGICRRSKSAVEEHVVCVADAIIVVLGRGLATVAATVAALAGVTLAVARDGQLGIGIVVEVDHEVEEAHTLLLPPALLLRLGLGPD